MVFAPLFVADSRGYYADENLVVEILANPGGSEPLAPLATGELDVVVGGAGAGLFNYAKRNLDLNDDPGFRIVAGVHSERQPMTSPLVVSAERFESGEITSVADLAGGRVAINAPGAATEYWMFRALEEGGVTLDEVELLAVSFPDVAPALNSPSSDRIDAAILGEPLVSFAEQDGLVVRLADDFIDGFQATFMYMSNDFIANNREAAVGFVRAYVRAVRDLEAEDAWTGDEISTILEEYTNVPAEINRNAARPYFPVNGEVNVENLATLQDYFLDKGDLSYEEPLDIAVMLDNSLLEEVIADLGRVETDDETADNMGGDEMSATEEPADS
jgi:NitT/TauT family transport system substrate-binding protein